MSVTAAVAAVESLRPDQKQFLKERKLHASMPAGRWSESLTQMVELGSITLTESSFYRQQGCFCMMVA